jgi:hypothetical protein
MLPDLQKGHKISNTKHPLGLHLQTEPCVSTMLPIRKQVDDVVVKTRNSSTLIDDLEETFASLREYRWKLNLNKCVFGVPSGKLLGFIIS